MQACSKALPVFATLGGCSLDRTMRPSNGVADHQIPPSSRSSSHRKRRVWRYQAAAEIYRGRVWSFLAVIRLDILSCAPAQRCCAILPITVLSSSSCYGARITVTRVCAARCALDKDRTGTRPLLVANAVTLPGTDEYYSRICSTWQ